MLKTRIFTAIVLLAVLLPVLFFGSPLAILLICGVFFCAACWESLRLFAHQLVIPTTIIWTGLFLWLAYMGSLPQQLLIWLIALVAWLLRFVPSLKFGLPATGTVSNRILSSLYLISVLACFLAMIKFQQNSTIYLLSVLIIVWIADVGAYFSGKAFGRNKLAPTISPGKSWEGAIGGWLCVLGVAAASIWIAPGLDSYPALLQHRLGWVGLCLTLSLLAAASVVGDLVESQLKRRAQVKDSSHLLPGHGGVLDRIDALIPVLPLAMLIELVCK